MKAYLEPSELKRLEEAATCLRDRLLIRILVRLGCRISEALGITVSDIDFDQGTVTIEHLKTRLKLSCPWCGAGLSRNAKFCLACGGRVEKAVAEEKEHRRRRTLPVDEDTVEMLREYVDRGGPVGTNGKRLLFGLSRGRVWQIVRESAIRAGLGQLVNPETGEVRGISPHRLSDAFAIHAVKLDDSGDGLRLLQEHLGHQSITTTMRYRKISGNK
ncbi:Tyrosine recombinase XerD [subsurface metagenome]